jgi:hypothetical protein
LSTLGWLNPHWGWVEFQPWLQVKPSAKVWLFPQVQSIEIAIELAISIIPTIAEAIVQ